MSSQVSLSSPNTAIQNKLHFQSPSKTFWLSVLAIFIFFTLFIIFFPKPCDSITNFGDFEGPYVQNCDCYGYKKQYGNATKCYGIAVHCTPGYECKQNVFSWNFEEAKDADTNDGENARDEEDQTPSTDDNNVELPETTTPVVTRPTITDSDTFYVALAPDSDMTILLKADIPDTASVRYFEGPGGSSHTEIILTDSIVSFSIPHLDLPEAFSSFTPIESVYIPMLYRIPSIIDEQSGYSLLFLYSNQITSEGQCEEFNGTFPAPCGNSAIIFPDDSQAVFAFCETNTENPASCDEIIATLRLAE